MKLVFLSNYFNHHQKPVSDAFAGLTEAYHFIETAPMPPERVQMGYGYDVRPDYVCSLLDPAEKPLCEQAIREADVVIFGSAPEELFRQCLCSGKILFRYSERPLKNGMEPLKYMPRWLRWHWRNPPGAQIYLLCASAYTASDYAKFGLFRGRAYRWGYFPPAVRYEDPTALLAKKDQRRILWVGRMLDWKRPDDAIRAAAQLKQAGCAFSMDLIGGGEMEPRLREMILENDLSDCVHLLGVMPPEEVRRHMECAGIFLMTSDRKEGWGAVLNEAMNSGCAVISSVEAGAAPYLVTPGETGLLFDSGDVKTLAGHAAFLLEHPEVQQRLGTAAYCTIVDLWNADAAAKRFVELAERILNQENESAVPLTGPCSEETA